MKRIVLASLLVVLLLSLTFVVASAGEIWDDPVLCVAGQWLTVNAAAQSAVTVYLPEHTPYGANGGCTTPAPHPVAITKVVTVPVHVHVMAVEVNGKQASQPTVSVIYGGYTKTKGNDGKHPLTFVLNLR